MNGLTSGAALFLGSFFDVSMNHGYWIRTVVAAANQALRFVGLA